MEAMERVDRTRDRIQTAVRYAKLLLSEAEPTGLLQLSASVKTQMQLLHGSATRGPGDDLDVLLKFETNPLRFEEALNASYGYFVQQRSGSGGSSSGPSSKPVSSLGLPTPSSTPQPPSPTHSSPLEGSGPHHHSSNSGGSMMSSYHAAMMKSGADLTHLPPNISPSLQQQRANVDLNSMAGHLNMTSIQEYNLQQLANLAGKQSDHHHHHQQQQHHHHHHHNSTSSLLQQQLLQEQQHQQQQLRLHLERQQQMQRQRATPSPHSAAAQSPFMLADLLSGDMNNMQALSNLQALAKLGSHGKTFFHFFNFHLI